MRSSSEQARQDARNNGGEGEMRHDIPLKVLLIEDNRDIAENICLYLDGAGHTTDYAANADQALGLAAVNRYDILIVDVMLPGTDGLSLCRRLRSQHDIDTPVLMLTARDELSDKLDGFDAGADDYMTKPFELEELRARLLALTRRASGRTRQVLRVGELQLDARSLRVTRDGTSARPQPHRIQASSRDDAGLPQSRVPGRYRAFHLGRRSAGQRCPEKPRVRAA